MRKLIFNAEFYQKEIRTPRRDHSFSTLVSKQLRQTRLRRRTSTSEWYTIRDTPFLSNYWIIISVLLTPSWKNTTIDRPSGIRQSIQFFSLANEDDANHRLTDISLSLSLSLSFSFSRNGREQSTRDESRSLLLKILRSFVALKINERRRKRASNLLSFHSPSRRRRTPSRRFPFRDERRKVEETDETRHKSHSGLLLRGTNEGLCIKSADSRWRDTTRLLFMKKKKKR